MDVFIEKTKKTVSDKTFLTVLASTVIFGLFAHGYCYFNLLFSHDSLLINQSDHLFQISLGRFLIPVYLFLRGSVYTPSLVGFLSLVFIAVSAYLTVKLFRINHPLSIVLVSGIMVVNCVVTLTNATYVHDIDIYMLALLLSVAGVSILRNGKPAGCMLAGVLFCCSLALYQSYLQVASAMIVLLLILDIFRGETANKVFREGLKSLLVLAVSVAVYYLLQRLIVRLAGTAGYSSYNNPTNLGFENAGAVLQSLAATYKNVFGFYLKPFTYRSVFNAVLNAIVIVCAVFLSVRRIATEKIHGGSLVLVIALYALLPFAMNFTCFLANGEQHTLMKYSMLLLYPFVLSLTELCCPRTELPKRPATRVLHPLISILLILMILCGGIYSSQVYLQKDLSYRNTSTIISRIISRMEQTEGYVPGKTPVAFCGSADSNPAIVTNVELFDRSAVGLASPLSVTYYMTLKYYFDNAICYPIVMVSEEEADIIANKSEVREMPVFPDKNSLKMIDGTLVVKLSQ